MERNATLTELLTGDGKDCHEECDDEDIVPLMTTVGMTPRR